MTPDLIFQIIVGGGMIAGMWRLTREVAALNETMKHIGNHQADLEVRVRKLEANHG